MAATLTTLDKLLKDVYLPGLADWVNTKRPIFGRIERITNKERRKVGRKYVLGVKEADGQSTGWVGEDETLPVGDNATPLQMEVAMKYHYAVARITAQAADASSQSDSAFEEGVTFELDSKRNQIEEDLAVNALYGSGYGELGQGSVSSTTLTMVGQPTVGGVGTRLLKKNMYIQSYSALSGGSQGANHKQITAINSTSTATIESSSGVNANDYLFRSVTASVDPRDKAMMGLGGIVDDGTRRGTFQALSRTTYPSLKANLLGNSGTLRPWSQDLMDALAVQGFLNGGGKAPTAYYSPWEIQQRAAAYLRADRQYDMRMKQLDGGYAGVTWTSPEGEAPWFYDRFCRPNEVMGVCESDLVLLINQDTTVVNDDGSMWRYTDRKDTKEVWFRTWRNLASRACNNHSVLRDISHTA